MFHVRGQRGQIRESVIPAKAGGAFSTAERLVIHFDFASSSGQSENARSIWIPAFAGMTTDGISV
jgi:hypothetical protein